MKSNVKRVMAPEFNSSNNRLGQAREPGGDGKGRLKKLKG